MIVINNPMISKHTIINMPQSSMRKRRRRRKEKLSKSWMRNDKDYNKIMKKIKIKEMEYHLSN